MLAYIPYMDPMGYVMSCPHGSKMIQVPSKEVFWVFGGYLLRRCLDPYHVITCNYPVGQTQMTGLMSLQNLRKASKRTDEDRICIRPVLILSPGVHKWGYPKNP